MLKYFTFHLFFLKTIQLILNAEEIKERGKGKVKNQSAGPTHDVSGDSGLSKLNPGLPLSPPGPKYPEILGCWAHPHSYRGLGPLSSLGPSPYFRSVGLLSNSVQVETARHS